MSDIPTKPRLVFFGSGPVAAESLRLLHGEFEIEAVITKPQPAHHKQAFPVLSLAKELGLQTFTPYGKAELSALFATRPVTSRVGLVVDYGFIINQDVIDYFPQGIINSHFSLLPEWRGADPISFAILSGQAQTGVSLMRIVAALDEGPILSMGVYEMDGTETTPSLTDYLVHLSAALLRNSLPRYVAGEINVAPQEAAARSMGRPFEPTYSRKLTKDDGILDFTKPAAQLEREVRAYLEWPRSRMTLAGKDVVITRARVETTEAASDRQVGEIFALPDRTIAIKTVEGLFVIERLKPAGKSEMNAAAFLAGNTL